MNDERVTLDTNILVYAMDADAGKRHSMAIEILECAIKSDCLLTLQALSEFYYVMTRKNRVSSIKAREHVGELSDLFPVITAKQKTLKQAMRAVDDHRLSFWDAMLWSTAKEAGVTLLLSEDFQHEQLLEGVRVVNPFKPNDFWTTT